jgi:hypothetical protein
LSGRNLPKQSNKGFVAYSVVLNPNDAAVSMQDGSVLKNSDGSPISILEAARARSDIEFIEEDQIMRTTAVQENAPWGLQRISSAQALPAGSRANALTFSYTFNETAGKGVDVYVIVRCDLLLLCLVINQLSRILVSIPNMSRSKVALALDLLLKVNPRLTTRVMVLTALAPSHPRTLVSPRPRT